jgi:hypothetical protein
MKAKYLLARAVAGPLQNFYLFKAVEGVYWQKMAVKGEEKQPWMLVASSKPVVCSLGLIWRLYNVQYLTEEEVLAELL